MYSIKINLYLKKQTKTITKQIVLKYYENPWREDSTWALNLIKTHVRKTINAKLRQTMTLKCQTRKNLLGPFFSFFFFFFQQMICPWLGHLFFNYTRSPAKSMHFSWFYHRMLPCKLNRFSISTVCYQGFQISESISWSQRSSIIKAPLSVQMVSDSSILQVHARLNSFQEAEAQAA